MTDDVSLGKVIDMLEDISNTHDIDIGHTSRTADMAISIGKLTDDGFRLDARKLKLLEYAARIHDLGRAGIDDLIIAKQGKLTTSQRGAMQQHPVIGYNFIRRANLPAEITLSVLYHHEHWDGSGYPEKLIGLDIPLYARIICIADTWDAILSKRPYHPERTVAEALREMNKVIHWFDPYLYPLFLRVIKEDIDDR